MKRTRLAALATAVLVSALATGCGGNTPTAARGTEDGTFTGGRLPAGGRLVIETDNGVRLRPAPGNGVAVDRSVRATRTEHGSLWVVDLDCPAPSAAPGADCPRMPTVEVPAAVAVTVTARDAGIDASGLTGNLDLTTVNGDVTVEESGGTHAVVALTTRNGSVRGSGLRAARLGATTVNGDVVLACADAPGSVDADTTNGSVRLSVPHPSPAYAVTTATSNGHAYVTLPTTTGSTRHHLDLRTVNGDVTAAVFP